MNITTMRVKKSTLEMIKQHGKKGESYDDILIRVFKEYRPKGGEKK